MMNDLRMMIRADILSVLDIFTAGWYFLQNNCIQPVVHLHICVLSHFEAQHLTMYIHKVGGGERWDKNGLWWSLLPVLYMHYMKTKDRKTFLSQYKIHIEILGILYFFTVAW